MRARLRSRASSASTSCSRSDSPFVEWIVRDNPSVEHSLESFDVYWNSHLSTEPELDSTPDSAAAMFARPNANPNSELRFVCRGQPALAAEVLTSIPAREAASGRAIDRGTIVERAALLGDSPLRQRLRFPLEMPIANLFDFLL